MILVVAQIVIATLSFFMALFSAPSLEPENSYNRYADMSCIQHLSGYLKLPKTICILKIFFHNYSLSLLQALGTLFTFGILGLFYVFKNFYIFGVVFKYTKNPFLFLEILGTALSIGFPTFLSFELYFNRKIKSLRKVIYFLVTILFIFLLAAYLEYGVING